MITPRAKPPTPDSVPGCKVRTLGRVGSDDYIEIGKDEYLLEPTVVRDPGDLAHRDGAVFVSFPDLVTDDAGRTLPVGTLLRRAVPLPAGSFQRAVARAERKTAAKPPRYGDRLDGLRLLERRGDRIIPNGPSAVSVAPALNRQPGGFVEGRGPIRGRAILALIERRGVQLSVHPSGRILASRPGGLCAN